MILPKGDEYNQAVQNPRIAFADMELQKCQVELTPLGLPKPYSGGFTTTYKFKNNLNHWAVRCFTREIKDLEDRYKAIGGFISRNSNCSFLVDAKFLNDGIKVNGKFHPIIKMKWLEGDSVNDYIEKYKLQRTIIESLASNFLNLVQKLNTFGIAHGDLQHGNIIIKNGNPLLIDYDGMYFPELSTLKVNELGHPNYQHPKRSPSHYNANIDRFSSLLIYLAIKAVAARPDLWNKYDNGDNLLFKSQDFFYPQKSQLFAELIAIPEISKLSKNFLAVCTWEYDKIPNINDFISNAYVPAILPVGTTVTIPIFRSAFNVIDGNLSPKILQNIGLRVEVVGKISSSYEGITKYHAPYLFLNFGSFPNQTFTIVIWSEVLAKINQAGRNPKDWIGKYVSVTGVISAYGLRPQIAIDNTNQIQFLSGSQECELKLRGMVASGNGSIGAAVNSTGRTYTPTTVFSQQNTRPSPVSSRPTYSSAPRTPTYQSSTPKTPSYQSTTPRIPAAQKISSSKKSDSTGCIIAVIGAVIGGIIGVSVSLSGIGFLIGGAIGLFVASMFSSAINS